MSDNMLVRYERAQILMKGIYSKKFILNTTLFPTWIGDSDCFWYERESRNGKEYRLVNAKTATNEVAFDHRVLAAALSEKVDQEVDASDLPINNVSIDLEPSIELSKKAATLHFHAFNKKWAYNVNINTCLQVKTAPEDCVISPDGKVGIFIRNFNLWQRNLENRKEQALTEDGEKDYIYGVGTACLLPINYADVQIRWSSDSKRIFAVQRDTRRIKATPIVHHVPQDGSLRPKLEERIEAYPGDDHIETLRLLAIDIHTQRIQVANYQQIPITRSCWPFFASNLGWWGNDNRKAYFVDVERGYKTARVVEFDTETGATRILFEESTKTHINLMLNNDECPALVPLPETGELLWFSERSGWAHLYLYNLETGELKNSVTQGEWLVRDVVFVDTKRREVFLQSAARSPDRDPYYRDLCRIHLDTGQITPIISSDHEYWVVNQKNEGTMIAKGLGRDVGEACGISPSANFAVVTRSRANEVPVSFLLNRDGQVILHLESADISALLNNWLWPEPVKLVASDGHTDIYGLVFRPTDFSAERSYPVVSCVYNSPDLPRVSKGSFSNGASFGIAYFNAAALAELGFIVVEIDGRGTPFRNKAFHDESYRCTELASNLNDHIAGIQQLAKRYPYMDLSRVGITNHPSGGMGVISGLCMHPNFYKVGVAVMPYDSRFIGAASWGEKYESLSGPIVDFAYAENLVDKLQGKLFLMNDMLYFIAPASGVFRVVDALQKANKDFDLLLLPNPNQSYLIRRTWDYLVKHLLETEPPKEFKLTTIFDGMDA